MKCQTIEYYDESGKPVYKLKHRFNKLDDAIGAAKIINSWDKTIRKVVAYKCTICFKYHVGRNGKELKEKDRTKYKKLNYE